MGGRQFGPSPLFFFFFFTFNVKIMSKNWKKNNKTMVRGTNIVHIYGGGGGWVGLDLINQKVFFLFPLSNHMGSYGVQMCDICWETFPVNYE